ncbi:hypothetical protein [Anabaena sp. PCC 7108]|uniref:hypothetical protein n=1 Tax=Anabaena sp. PCC 7108 TaxID=163908 RepID=UPI000345F215|nr:hypothetical protein [Anabaena sp. PCC 7108]
MIDVRTAVSAASQYIESLKDIMGSSLPDLRLEEVELSEDKSFWLITLGFDAPLKPQKNAVNSLNNALGLPMPTSQREYKLIKVNSQTGEVEAMKIRKI